MDMQLSEFLVCCQQLSEEELFIIVAESISVLNDKT